MLGLVFWSLLTARIPFLWINNDSDLLSMFVQEMIDKNTAIPLEFPENTPQEFIDLICECCSFHEKDRPSDSELMKTLTKLSRSQQQSSFTESIIFEKSEDFISMGTYSSGLHKSYESINVTLEEEQGGSPMYLYPHDKRRDMRYKSITRVDTDAMYQVVELAERGDTELKTQGV